MLNNGAKFFRKGVTGIGNIRNTAVDLAKKNMPGEETGGVCDVNSIMPCKNNLTESCKEDDNRNNLFTCQKDQKKIDALKEKKDKAWRTVNTIRTGVSKKATDIQGQLSRQTSDERMKVYQENPEEVVSSAYPETSSNCNCYDRLTQIIEELNAIKRDCKTCQCCNPSNKQARDGGNKKSVKNTKRNNKVKSVKKKRSSQSGGKVHPWREHIKKTRLSNPGVKDFGQIIQMAKQTYKK